MKTLREMGIKLEFALGALEPSAVSQVCELLQSTSNCESSDWVGAVWPEQARGADVIVEDAAAFIREAVADRVPAASVSRKWQRTSGEVVREGIGVGYDTYMGCQGTFVEISLGALEQEPFFIRVCETLGPRHGLYMPEYNDPRGSQSMILEMALQRDYSMYGDRSDAPFPPAPRVAHAKAISPLLPRLRHPMPDPSGLPGRLGWLNYWQADVARELGFPDPEKDARLLTLCERLKSGAWLVKLTEESLDLTRPDHMEALAQAYWRFDKIGKRMRPTAKKVKPRVKRAEAEAATAQGFKAFIVRERDASGQWWNAAAEPIHAVNAEEALRIYFAGAAHGRAPRPKESLSKLRDAYDALATEVGLTRGADIDVAEAEGRRPQS